MKKTTENALTLTHNFFVNNQKKVLHLYGRPGVGKTYIAMDILSNFPNTVIIDDCPPDFFSAATKSRVVICSPRNPINGYFSALDSTKYLIELAIKSCDKVVFISQKNISSRLSLAYKDEIDIDVIEVTKSNREELRLTINSIRDIPW